MWIRTIAVAVPPVRTSCAVVVIMARADFPRAPAKLLAYAALATLAVLNA
jgi:hypothetical protein